MKAPIDLVKYLLSISDEEKMHAALSVLLSEKEMEAVEKRLKILQMLRMGKSQRQIARELKVGIATVTRGSHAAKMYDL